MQVQTFGSKIDCDQYDFEEWPFYDLKCYGFKSLAAVTVTAFFYQIPRKLEQNKVHYKFSYLEAGFLFNTPLCFKPSVKKNGSKFSSKFDQMNPRFDDFDFDSGSQSKLQKRKKI